MKKETLISRLKIRSVSYKQKKEKFHSRLVLLKSQFILLPEQQKTLLHLRDMEQLEFEEIAQITGFDMNYIRVNLSRARKKIRERIKEIENYATTGTTTVS